MSRIQAAMRSSGKSMADVVAEFSRPTFVNGKWRKPQMSLRELAVLRKQLRDSGELRLGETYPAELHAHAHRRRVISTRRKFSKFERNREKRDASIVKKLNAMEKQVAKVKKMKEDARTKDRQKDLEYLIQYRAKDKHVVSRRRALENVQRGILPY